MAKGNLFIVATPIGNMDDITIRALDTLKKVDIIAAEDTRKTGLLLARHEIGTRLVSCHEHNEDERAEYLLDKIGEGASVALVSDAGTPSVSDPGYRLVKKAISAGVKIVPLPGPCAAIAALSVSGLPSDSFVFVGFAAKKKGKRLNRLKDLADEQRTLVFYESPVRIVSFINELLNILGDRPSVLAREITKPYEEFFRGSLSGILQELEARPSVKGECTLLVSGCGEKEVSQESLEHILNDELAKPETKLSGLAKRIAATYGLPKKKVYEQALEIKAAIKGKENK